jgi:hypothetical protein
MNVKYLVGMLVSSLFSASLFSAGDNVESWIAPAAQGDNFTVTSRADGRVCFEFDYTKLRLLKTHFFNWSIVTDNNPRNFAFVSPYSPETKTMAVIRLDQPIGISEHRARCFDVPEPLRGADRPMTLVSHLSFETWHNLWFVPATIGPFNIPAFNQEPTP